MKYVLLVIFVVVVVVGGGALFAYQSHMSDRAAEDRALRERYEKYEKSVLSAEETLRADTYGGTTPEETLELFVNALRAGDVEHAVKYVALREIGGSTGQDTLVRALGNMKERGELLELVELLATAEPAGSSMDGYFGFEVRDEDGNLISDVSMVLNQYSGVWKIESF